jgi:hypothetical protein
MDNDNKSIVSLASRNKAQEVMQLQINYVDGEKEIVQCTGYGTLVDIPDMFFIGGIDGDPKRSQLIRIDLIKKVYLSDIII